MEENLQKEDGVSLMDIIRLLLSKLKWLILIVILGGIVGGSFAVWRTYDINYYGTKIEFYVNPERPKETTSDNASQFGVYGAYGRHVMDNMVKLLSSESFTEQLILNGEPLPEKQNWTKSYTKGKTKEEVEQEHIAFTKELNALIDSANMEISTAETAKMDAAAAKAIMLDALDDLEDLWESQVPALGVPSSYWTFSEKAYVYLKTQLSEEIVFAYGVYSEAKEEAEEAQRLSETASLNAEKYTEDALELWRTSRNYKSLLELFSGKVSYTYLEANADIDDANNLARSFIYVSISVLGDQNKDFAFELRERVIKVVPQYVEENMTVPSDYEGTNCQRISRTDEIHLTNERYTTNQAIKYGILFAAAAFAVACVVFIVADRSDKRLRDHNAIPRLFNVPVLGIVPTIDDLAEKSIAKKKGYNPYDVRVKHKKQDTVEQVTLEEVIPDGKTEEKAVETPTPVEEPAQAVEDALAKQAEAEAKAAEKKAAEEAKKAEAEAKAAEKKAAEEVKKAEAEAKKAAAAAKAAEKKAADEVKKAELKAKKQAEKQAKLAEKHAQAEKRAAEKHAKLEEKKAEAKAKATEKKVAEEITQPEKPATKKAPASANQPAKKATANKPQGKQQANKKKSVSISKKGSRR